MKTIIGFGALLIGGLPGAEKSPHEFETEVSVAVSEDLQNLELSTQTRYRPSADADRVTIVLALDRLKKQPDRLLPVDEQSLFPRGFDSGGFEGVEVEIDGAPCSPTVRWAEEGDGARFLDCAHAPAHAVRRDGGVVHVATRARVRVPHRYGPIGYHAGQLTLAGGWYPFVAREEDGPAPRGRVRVTVRMPNGRAAVIGGRYFPATGDPNAMDRPRVLTHETRDVAQMPLIVLPWNASAWSLASGKVQLIARGAQQARLGGRHAARLETLVSVLEDGLAFLQEQGLERWPDEQGAWTVVTAPLRRDLAHATEHGVIVSDFAFRLFPADRFYRFHRFPILREMFTHWALRHREQADLGAVDAEKWHVTADAVGAWLVDRYVGARFGRAENAFDVLWAFSWIPAIDSMLYAPQLPFVGAFFRLVDESDRFRPNVIDYPSKAPRGKIVYEKLVDRVGVDRTNEAMFALIGGVSLQQAVADALEAAGVDRPEQVSNEFLETWLGPYPSVRYQLVESSSRGDSERDPNERDPIGGHHEARIVIRREGDVIAEPVQVHVKDEEGNERFVWSESTKEELRVVTATLSAPLAFVEIDPNGRLAETPSEANPSPRFDNRSSPKWRVLLNNFNLLLSVSAGDLDTAIDVGISRVRDVRLSHAIQAAYGPDSVSLSGRTSYGFGSPTSADRLGHWAGVLFGGEYLRPEFAGSESGAFAASSGLYYGYDDRTTVWAPEAGTAVRLSLEYSHVFGSLPSVDASNDVLSVVAKALRSWRIAAQHQISVRGSVGAFVVGEPLPQLLYRLGGRRNVRGYDAEAVVGRFRAIASAEWVHLLLSDLDHDTFAIAFLTGIDGALFADVSVLSPRLGAITDGPVFADVGYGLRFYLDYFGVRPGVMAIDVAFPLVNPVSGRAEFGAPAVYLDFTQSFLIF